MILRPLLSVISALPLAHSVQPNTPYPPEAPLRELPWSRQLNFLHTTDTHGWHAGHLQEASFTGDWGDYVSFAHHLRARADADGSDLLLIDTGDKVEGNGLYDASEPKGKYTYPIYNGADVDVITVGNHELYRQNTSEAEWRQVVPRYKETYIASNVDIINPKTGERVPLAQRYRKFTTKNQGIRVLAFGFLFDFKGSSDHAFVQTVEEAVREKWFQDAIRDKDVDLMVVIGHSAARDKEFRILYETIRDTRWDMPIMFFGGHLHIRDYVKFDKNAFALASGRYMETIGFASIDGITAGGKKGNDSDSKDESSFGIAAAPTYARRYIDNNLFSLHHHSGTNASTFDTPKGKNISAAITSARKALHLDERFGCAPRDLWTNRAPYPEGPGSDASVFTWLTHDVLPEMVIEKNRSSVPRIVMANTGTMRFDVFKGPFTRDTTYIIQPFTNGFRYIPDVPFRHADRLLLVLNKGGQIFDAAVKGQGLSSRMLMPPMQAGRAMLPLSAATQSTVSESNSDEDNGEETEFARGSKLQNILGLTHNLKPTKKETPKLVPGYTTHDDAGDDGDDTEHAEVEFFAVPNVFEARVLNTTSSNKGSHEGGDENPETVDVVFLEFIQPWVLAGLRFLGGEYEVDDTAPYAADMDFTTMISSWVGRHWNETEC